MKIAGKRQPETEALQDAANEGFRHVELYLEKQHLNNISQTVKIIQDAPITVSSVHTPHVRLDEGAYLERAAFLAAEFDAKLVFHSGCIHYSPKSKIDDAVTIEQTKHFENHPGHSLHHIENHILADDDMMTLDLAHLYVGVGKAKLETEFERLLREYETQIGVVHFCDAIGPDDGYSFDDGDINLENTWEILEQNYDGLVVLELPINEQYPLVQELKKKYNITL